MNLVGTGFGNTKNKVTVQVGGTGISVVVDAVTTREILATFTIAANAEVGNHAVSVKVGNQPSNSVNFFVQVPTRLRRDSISALMNQQGGCGATKTLEYTLLDQAGEVIAEDLTVDEVLSNFTSNPSGLPPPLPKHALANAGHLVDEVGYRIATCPPPFTISLTQKFTVKIGQTTYNLTTTNSVSYGRDASGNKFVTVTNTIP